MLPSKDTCLSLTTLESKNNFLLEIYQSDQSIRVGNNSIDWNKVDEIDSLNLIKIDQYLGQYGYPDTIHFSKNATETPWFVIQLNY